MHYFFVKNIISSEKQPLGVHSYFVTEPPHGSALGARHANHGIDSDERFRRQWCAIFYGQLHLQRYRVISDR